MIDIAAIPVINGDPDMLDEHATSLATTGAAFADTGARIHAGWQALAPVYLAPEAGDLLAATGPVQGVAASVGEDYQLVGRALTEYSAAMREIRLRLDALRSDASALVAEVGDAEPDDGQAEQSAQLSSAVTLAMADFDEAQRRCAATIRSLYGDRFGGGPRFFDDAQAQLQALDDAVIISNIIGDSGLVSPDALLGGDPAALERLAAQYPQLRDVLARAAGYSAQDPDYAVALLNALGPRDVRTLADLTNTFGIAYDKGILTGDPYGGFVVPFAAVLAAGDRSDRLNPAIRSAVFDVDATDEPGGEGGVDNLGYAEQLRDMRYRSLALLAGAGDFTPQTTADLANALIQDGPVAPTYPDFSGFSNAQFLSRHRDLASNEWAALAALREDDQAANIFYRTDRDEFPGELENLYLIGQHPGDDVAARRLGLTAEDAQRYGDQMLADTLRGGIQTYPITTGQAYAPETIALVEQAVKAAGAEDIEASDPVRNALVDITTPYTRDLAIVAAGGGPDRLPTRLPGLSVEDVQAFVGEVSGSEQARVALGQNGAALVQAEIADETADIASNDPRAFGSGVDLSAAYYRTLGEGWNQLQLDRIEQREALVEGWRTVTDPAVDLVSGKFVERIPILNTASEIPGVGDALDEATGAINESLNTAIYDHAIPKPELEALTTWRDAVEPEVHAAVATALYENPDTRASFLAQAQVDPQDTAHLAEINADGQVTFEEFRSLSDVQDAVHTYGGDVLTRLQAEAAFDMGSAAQEESAGGKEEGE